MAKNNKKKTKETKTIVENKEEIIEKKEEIIEKKEEAVGEKDVPADDKRRELIQNTIPNKAMNMFFSSWWAISAALALYLFFYAATVHEEEKYAMLNQIYSISDMNLLVFYTENAILLFNFVWILLVILVPGFYLCVGLFIFRNLIITILSVCFIIIVVSTAYYIQGKISLGMVFAALLIAVVYLSFLKIGLQVISYILKGIISGMLQRIKSIIFINTMLQRIKLLILSMLCMVYKFSGILWLKEKFLTSNLYVKIKEERLKSIHCDRTQENVLAADLLITQMMLVFYAMMVCMILYVSVLSIFTTVAYNRGKNVGIIELNKRMEKSNTPINVEPKYFEIEIPTVSCNDSSCIKLGQQRIDSIE